MRLDHHSCDGERWPDLVHGKGFSKEGYNSLARKERLLPSPLVVSCTNDFHLRLPIYHSVHGLAQGFDVPVRSQVGRFVYTYTTIHAVIDMGKIVKQRSLISLLLPRLGRCDGRVQRWRLRQLYLVRVVGADAVDALLV